MRLNRNWPQLRPAAWVRAPSPVRSGEARCHCHQPALFFAGG